MVKNDPQFAKLFTNGQSQAVRLPKEFRFEGDRVRIRHLGLIRANLSESGMSIGPFDILIAGQALRRKLIMVTGNVGELSRVKDLVVVNWSR